MNIDKVGVGAQSGRPYVFIDKRDPTGKKIALYIEFVEVGRWDSTRLESQREKGGRLKTRYLRGLGSLPPVCFVQAELDISSYTSVELSSFRGIWANLHFR
jgi:hypothetical protein